MSVLESHQRFSLRRLKALVVKEALQVLRDPSSLLIAFVLPPIHPRELVTLTNLATTLE